MIRSKAQWMDQLAIELATLSSISTATRFLKSVQVAETACPYIGIVSVDESIQLEDNNCTRYLSGITLYILTKEQDTGIEEIIQDIKGKLRTINLGSNVYQVNFVRSNRVSVEDYYAADGDKYANTRVDLNVIWSHNFSSGSNQSQPASKNLTEPIAMAHYKVYSLLYSGSFSSQPDGTNVYPSNLLADISIPTGSGSILVGVASDDLNDGGIYSNSVIDNHSIQLTVDIVTAYTNGQANLYQTTRLVDNVVNKLRSNYDLGDDYKMIDSTPIREPFISEHSESSTIGARINVTVEKAMEYVQE